MAANIERGEVEVTVGGRALTLAVTMDGLAKVSSAIRADGLDIINTRLARNEPNTVRAAIEHFATSADAGRKAAAAMKPAELFTASTACVSALLLAFQTDDQGNADTAGENG